MSKTGKIMCLWYIVYMADITEISIGQTLLLKEQTDLIYTLLLYRWKRVCGMHA
jgi:hypothetical protein